MSIIDLADKQIYANDVGKAEAIGAVGETSDGRRFRYALEGGNAVVASVLCQARATDSSWDTVAIVNTVQVGDNRVTITNQSDAWTGDELENGFVVCETDPGNTGPNIWRIGGNDSIGATTGNFDIWLAGGATFGQQLIAGTDVLNYMPSLWSKFLIQPSTVTGVPVGVTMVKVTAGYYSWLQTRGVGACLMQDPDATVGENLTIDNADAGSMDNVTISSTLAVVARTITTQGLTNSDAIPVFLIIE